MVRFFMTLGVIFWFVVGVKPIYDLHMVKPCDVAGEDTKFANLVFPPYPMDHRAVVAMFEIL